MAIIELTTATRVKTALAIDPTDTAQDTWIAAAIQSVSQRLELHMDRPVELVERTEEYDVHDGRQATVFLRAYPITSVASIKNDQRWDWASTVALTADEDYHVDSANGQVHLNFQPAAGAKALQVVYTGGLAANTADLITNYPLIAQAADLQIAAMFRRRSAPQGAAVAGKQGGSITHEAPLKLIPDVREALASLQRLRFGI